MINLKKQKWLWGLLLVLLLTLVSVAFSYNKQKYEKEVLTRYSGDYVMGDGMFMSCDLAINPNKTFILSRSSDTANEKIIIQGNVVIAKNYITLIPIDWAGPKMPCMVDNLVLVIWDGRAYLMPNDEDEFSKTILTRFCKNIRENFELKSERMGSVFPYIKAEDLVTIRSNDIKITTSIPIKFNGEPVCTE